MTNYNERLDEVLYDYWARHRYCENGCQSPDKGEVTKQAITSLIKELVAEAKPMVTSVNVIATYLQNGMNQKAVEHHSRNHAINEFEQNLLKALEEV